MSAGQGLGDTPWAAPPPGTGPAERWQVPDEVAAPDLRAAAMPMGSGDGGSGDGGSDDGGSDDGDGWDDGPDMPRRGGAGRRRHADGRGSGGRDRRRSRRSAPERPVSSSRLAPPPPGTRRYLVLGSGQLTDDVAAVDLDSGVLVRLQGGLPAAPDGTVEPFDVVDAVVSAPGVADDPSRPEALLVAGPLQRAGVRRGRRVRRRLRSMVAPAEPHLLGFPGTSWPYWELNGGRPSVAVVTPSRGPMLFRRAEDGSAWVRFGWYRTDNWLPLQDRRAVAVLQASGRRRLSGKALVTALGFRPTYLVVAVGLPRAGYCTKSVLALLPRA